jgi:flavin reductase (DIM6/NTAB) family NADH-FMN oxidoreductase RutF
MDVDGAFGKVVNGVSVITVKAGGKVNGMAAAWVTRVSFAPPLVAVSVGHTRFTHDLIKEAGSFCVNILASGQMELANNFGFKSGRNNNKFKVVEYATGKTGSPVLKGTAGYLDCRVVEAVEAGDHTVFIGEVIDASSSDKKPLIYNSEEFF